MPRRLRPLARPARPAARRVPGHRVCGRGKRAILSRPVARGVHIAAILTVALLAGCHDEHWLTYPWDDRRVLCSDTIDDLRAAAPWDIVEDQMEVA